MLIVYKFIFTNFYRFLYFNGIKIKNILFYLKKMNSLPFKKRKINSDYYESDNNLNTAFYQPNKKYKKDEEKLYNLTKIHESTSKKFKINQQLYDLDLNIANKTFSQAVDDFKNLFVSIHSDFIAKNTKNTRISLVFNHPLFKDNIWFPFMKSSSITPTILMNKFDMMVQSFKLNQQKLEKKHNLFRSESSVTVRI